MLMITVIDLGNIVQFHKNTIGSYGVTVQYSKNYLFFRRYYPVFEKTVRFVAVTVRETKTQSILPQLLSRIRKYNLFCRKYYPEFENHPVLPSYYPQFANTIRFSTVTVHYSQTLSNHAELLSTQTKILSSQAQILSTQTEIRPRTPK
ncbi:hypothetical protein [Siminovitchia terrae]|uniref:hypothetical protein n=1 Tax=Siminovitchia terrae TaxID=1914933 RepID=UPI0028B09AA7|nr:hypothetical protein [Siminovitchia terrae]